MFERGRHLFERIALVLAFGTFTLASFALPSAYAASGARSAGGGQAVGRVPAGIARGAMGINRGHLQASRGGAVHTGFSGGFHGGFGRQLHSGITHPGIHHHRSPFFGHNRFHHRPFFFFNLGGFVPYFHSPYYSYQPYPYYPPYPAYPIAYGASYPGVSAPYPYFDPVGVYPQTSAGDVQVYTALPEPAPAPLREPASQTQEYPLLPPSLDDGSLRFDINPADAQVFLDGRYVGEAHELRNIAEIPASAGRHLLEIRVGTESSFTAVAVSPGKITPVRFTLPSSGATSEATGAVSGRLQVQVTPPGGAVYLDGVFSTVAGSSQPASLILSPGPHRVQVVMPGYKAYSESVTVPEGGEAAVSVQLTEE